MDLMTQKDLFNMLSNGNCWIWQESKMAESFKMAENQLSPILTSMISKANDDTQ
jgi:hypothetical protein